MRAVLLALLAGCNVQSAATAAAAPPPPEPHVAALHVKLFDAADRGDVDAFQALLTPQSVSLLDAVIARMAAMPRPAQEPVFGWKDVLRFHASLTAAARQRAPYPAQGDRLDLAAHPDARLFTEMGAR